MRDLLKINYDLTRTAPDKYQTELDVGMTTSVTKHCTAYLDVVYDYTAQAGEDVTLPDLGEGVYVMLIDDAKYIIVRANYAVIIYYAGVTYIYDDTIWAEGYNIYVRRSWDTTIYNDTANLHIVIAAMPSTDNVQTNLVAYRPSKDGITYRHTGG